MLTCLSRGGWNSARALVLKSGTLVFDPIPTTAPAPVGAPAGHRLWPPVDAFQVRGTSAVLTPERCCGGFFGRRRVRRSHELLAGFRVRVRQRRALLVAPYVDRCRVNGWKAQGRPVLQGKPHELRSPFAPSQLAKAQASAHRHFFRSGNWTYRPDQRQVLSRRTGGTFLQAH